MATRLENYVSHGSISNESPGKVIGEIWLIDADEPITLELQGNPHRDLAGTSLTFKHREAKLESGDSLPDLAKAQHGTAGDITASKKSYHQESILDDPNSTTPSLVNSLCIEWYDESGQRFAIDSFAFDLSIGAAKWQMDPEDEATQQIANTKLFHSYIDGIANRITDEDDDGDDGAENEQPLNEFQWEQRLKESDRITQAYMEALDKYQDLPEQESLVAAAMGWNKNSETGEIQQWTLSEEDESDDDMDDFFSMDELDADAWMDSDDRESDNHPLYTRAQEFSNRLLREAQDMSILDSEDDSAAREATPAQTLVFASMDLSAKLAGALNGISQSDPEPGLIVAWLKRGLPIVDSALAAAKSAYKQGVLPQEWIEAAQKDLFEIRAGMLDLIQEFREQLP